MFAIIGHQGNSNPNYIKIPAHFRMSILKKLKKGWGLSTVVDKINMEFPQKPSKDLAVLISGKCQEDSKSARYTDSCEPLFITTLFTIRQRRESA